MTGRSFMKITARINGTISEETLRNACLNYLKHAEVREAIKNEKIQNQVR